MKSNRLTEKLKMLVLSVTVATLGAVVIWAQTSTKSPVQVQVPASVRATATSPTPPSDAKQASSVGKDKTKANTANSAGDTDSYWEQEVDVDGDGQVDEVDMLWDSEDKVLYLYADGTFSCTSGGTGNGGMLIALYGQGNTHNKPVGSGWYAVDLDRSECGVQRAAVYGCRFDAHGTATACGVATIDDKTDDITIVAASTE